VQDELLDALAPGSVKAWIESPPPWLEVRTPASSNITFEAPLDDGERQAITLAYASGPNASLLIDERAGRNEAERLGLQITGTLGVLLIAHHRGLLDIRESIGHLRATTFKATDSLIEEFLKLV
jgi:predicted nucleic acid-binding protein